MYFNRSTRLNKSYYQPSAKMPMSHYGTFALMLRLLQFNALKPGVVALRYDTLGWSSQQTVEVNGVELYNHSNRLRQSLLCQALEQRKYPPQYKDGYTTGGFIRLRTLTVTNGVDWNISPLRDTLSLSLSNHRSHINLIGSQNLWRTIQFLGSEFWD